MPRSRSRLVFLRCLFVSALGRATVRAPWDLVFPDLRQRPRHTPTFCAASPGSTAPGTRKPSRLFAPRSARPAVRHGVLGRGHELQSAALVPRRRGRGASGARETGAYATGRAARRTTRRERVSTAVDALFGPGRQGRTPSGYADAMAASSPRFRRRRGAGVPRVVTACDLAAR